ncbi:peptidoglycan DD-metalloendopeptidase family protein [Agitococcus lubricus]|nr:peptidoglycan DD-metalloendopeptidase family protein [Agitococcus lubricus]
MPKNSWLAPTLVALLMTGCASVSKKEATPPAPNTNAVKTEKPKLTQAAPPTYRVKAGDTLYSISVRFDKDYRELAKINNLDEKFTIYVDQQLRLDTADADTPAPATVPATKPIPSNKPIVATPIKDPTPSTTVAKKPAETVVKNTPSVGTNVQAISKSGSLTWSWPITGQLLKRFSSEGVGSKGIDIAGKRGDIVKASADGVVVYAGEGLVGYGKLIILRHNDEYITAYAHNDRLIASEGQRVKLGQTIAEVGSTGTDRDKLHFEIRYKGKPIDPLTILPN